jgi:type IV pilus assembly protein PilF
MPCEFFDAQTHSEPLEVWGKGGAILKKSCVLTTLAILAVGCASSGSRPKDEREMTQLQQAADFNAQLGSDYFRQGNWSEAKEKLDRALEEDPRNVNAHMIAGLLYDRLGELDKAETHFQRAVALDEKNAEVRNAYSVFLCRHEKYAAGEKNALIAAAEPLYKAPETALFNAGNCARDSGNPARAEKHYRKALEFQPRFAPALLSMAELEFRSGQYLPARAFLERHFAVAQPQPPALLLGVRIETALGNRSVAADYARRLKNDFSSSDEAKALSSAEPPKR